MLVIGEVGLSGEVRAVVNAGPAGSRSGKLGFSAWSCPMPTSARLLDNPELVMSETFNRHWIESLGENLIYTPKATDARARRAK